MNNAMILMEQKRDGKKRMKKCIIEYHEEEHNCYCQDLRECKVCSTGNNRQDKECIVSPNGFCTCRECGNAVRADGYSYKNSNR